MVAAVLAAFVHDVYEAVAVDGHVMGRLPLEGAGQLGPMVGQSIAIVALAQDDRLSRFAGRGTVGAASAAAAPAAAVFTNWRRSIAMCETSGIGNSPMCFGRDMVRSAPV